MITLNIITGVLYTTIILSYIWARYRFFRIEAATPKPIARLYDPVVAIHIIFSYYFLLTLPLPLTVFAVISIMFFTASLIVFWWCIRTVRNIGFAMSATIETLHVSGPFKFVRHPFYTSYCLTWLGTSVMFNSIELWITLAYLLAFYYRVASAEELIILKSQYSREYQAYSQRVGMFLPRITKWKS